MEKDEFEEFDNNINGIPYWVKSKKDILLYAKHMAYRYYQALDMQGFYAKKLLEMFKEKYKDQPEVQYGGKTYFNAGEIEYEKQIETEAHKLHSKFDEFYEKSKRVEKIVKLINNNIKKKGK